MKRPQFAFLLCLQVGFLVGLLTGWLSLTVLVSACLEDYHRLIRQYVSTISEKETRLQKLEEALAAAQERRYIVREIKLRLDYAGDEIERIALEEYARDKFSGLIGKEVQSVDVDIIGVIIDGRITALEGKEYVYNLDYAVLTETLHLWLSARPVN